MQTVMIPTISNKPQDFDNLFQLWQQVYVGQLDVRFDFTECRFLRDNAVAFLGGLARLVASRSGRFDFAWETLLPNVRKNLEKMGLLDAFGVCKQHEVGNSIPYREDRIADRDGIIGYLKSMWIGRDWVHVSPLLSDAIAGTVWEIYANAFDHAKSPVGVMSCGQHYPRRRELCLSVVDFGVGIPYLVRNFLNQMDMPAKEALEWAFQRGTTTKPNGIARGLGLDLLKEFIRVNNGRLELFSHDGYTVVDKTGAKHNNRGIFFEGTLLNLTLKCDERYYLFASEVMEKPLF